MAMTGVQGTDVPKFDTEQHDTALGMALLWFGPLLAFVLALVWVW